MLPNKWHIPIARSSNLLLCSVRFRLLQSLTHSFLQFVHSNDRSVSSSEATSSQSAIQFSLFQFQLSSLFLKVIQQFLTSPSSSHRDSYPTLYLSIDNLFQKDVPTQAVTHPVSFLRSIIRGMQVIPFSLTRCNTYSFLTRSVQLIVSILLQNHISSFPCIPDLRAKVFSVPCKAVFQM